MSEVLQGVYEESDLFSITKINKLIFGTENSRNFLVM